MKEKTELWRERLTELERQTLMFSERSDNPVLVGAPKKKVQQLSWRARVTSWPVLGPIIYWFWSLLRLPFLLKNLRQRQTDLEIQLKRHHLLVDHYEKMVRSQALVAAEIHAQSAKIDWQYKIPDSVYHALEERLRGSHQEIAQRQRAYLTQVQLRANHLNLPILDLGCGRGEWLHECAQLGIRGEGVDCNIAMLDVARERGLSVHEGDALTFLLAQAPNSYAVVSAFQVVEHLPPQILWAWLLAIYRVLAPGGAILLETPNPENLQVAAYSFRFDPSHTQPLPPPLLDVLVQQAGFAGIRIDRYAPWPEYLEVDTAYPEYLRKLLFCEQDYALWAHKP